MNSEFYHYSQSKGLRHDLLSLVGDRRFFLALRECDQRIEILPPSDSPDPSLFPISIPADLGEVWSMAAGVKFNLDSVLFTHEQVKDNMLFLSEFLSPDLQLMLPIGEMGDGDYFLLDKSGMVNWWSYEENSCLLCGDIWDYIASHVSWRREHFKK